VDPALVPERSCGTCNVCCIVPKIDEPALQKLPGCRCPNALADGSCSIYATRPRTCRDFFCGWRLLAWIDERLRPDRSGMLIRPTDDEKLVAGRHEFALIFTALGRDGLAAPGLVEAIITAIDAGIPSYLVVPGPPGYSSCRAPLNRALRGPVERNDATAVLASLTELYEKALGDIGKTRPVVLTARDGTASLGGR
jgi:hypothetical protein